MIVLRLPLPPSLNHYYGKTKTGDLYLTADGRRYRDIVKWTAKGQSVGESNVRMDVIMAMPNKGRRDVDNYLKCLFDALAKAKVYADDKQVFDLHVIKMLDPEKKGFFMVMIDEYKGGW